MLRCEETGGIGGGEGWVEVVGDAGAEELEISLFHRPKTREGTLGIRRSGYLGLLVGVHRALNERGLYPTDRLDIDANGSVVDGYRDGGFAMRDGKFGRAFYRRLAEFI